MLPTPYYIDGSLKNFSETEESGKDFSQETFDQHDFEPLQHERLSEYWYEDFQRYFDRWIKFWPKNSRGGYYHKWSYNTSWKQPKSKKNPDRPRHLWGDYLIEHVEHHLDRDHWQFWKEGKRIHVKESQFWLGLNMPKKTTVSCIDLDTKQYLLGYYRLSDNSPPSPVVYLPLEHFKKLKLVHDHFPGRIWCISSDTLGLHVWRKFPSPMETLKVHWRTKQKLARLGLGAVEVHPMKGRCLRRPFGEDYATITPTGLITFWVSQLDFFESVATTPPFELIARTLLDKVRRQWGLWRSSGDAISKNVHPRKVIAEHQHHLDEAEAWIEQGCPVEVHKDEDKEHWSRWIDAGCPTRTQAVTADAGGADQLDRWVDAGCPSQEGEAPCPILVRPPDKGEEMPLPTPTLAALGRKQLSKKTRPEQHDRQGGFDLEALRNGRWVKGLREIAINGLPCEKSLHICCYELAKWLYWIELYKQPDCEKAIVELLSSFVRTKHNGHCQRINDEDWPSVEHDLKNAIKSAKKLDPAYRLESLELFARLRQKRDLGQYKEVINLAPILAGDEALSSSSLSSPGLLICISTLESPLPEQLQAQIEAKAGRNRVISFATRLINLLYQQGGSCRLHQDKLMELLGYKNPTRATKYRDILIAAKVLTKGRYYRQGRVSRLYILSKEVMGLLDSSRVKKDVVA